MKRLGYLALLTGLASVGAAAAEDARVPGEGVICAYGLYGMLQFTAKVCDWERVPFGDALDRAMADIEAYILANATDPTIVKTTRSNMHAGESIWATWLEAEQKAYCEGESQAMIMDGVPIRASDPAILERYVKELLAVPGEPTFGSCL